MTDDRLDSALAALRRTAPAVTWADVERRLDRDAADLPDDVDGRHPLRRRMLVVVAAAAVAVAGAVILRPGHGNDPVRTGPSSTGTSPTTDGSTTTTTPATRAQRASAVALVAGDDYLVWGGEAGANDVSARADGFAVDLATGEVTMIPPAPIDPRSGATGVWTGSELIVCCGTGQADGYPYDTRSAAAWNPTTASWRVLAPPPASVARAFAASVWTGDAMVVVATGPAAASYDPTGDTWTEIPAPPLAGRQPDAAWTGSEVIVWDAVFGSGRTPPDGSIADRGWGWAPADDEWTPLPELPPGARTSLGSMVWTGTEIVVWGESTGDEGIGTGARWRPGDDGWTAMAASPQGRVDDFEGTAGSQTVVADLDSGDVAVRGLDGGGGEGEVPPLYAYDPTDDSWTATELVVPGHQPDLHIVGGGLLVPDEVEPFVGVLPTG